MGRIGASLSGIERTLLNKLNDANAASVINSLRLATGKKINSASDNPSGFVALSEFRSRLKIADATATNISAASSSVSQAQTTLDLIRTQLNTIRTLAIADEGGVLSTTDRATNQAAIDAAITEIDRLSSTNINGRRLLDGSANYQFSGFNATQVRDLKVFAVGASTATQRAKAAELTYTGTGGLAAAAATITLIGDQASTQLSIATTDSLSDIARRINTKTAQTAIVAEATGDKLSLRSIETGPTSRVTVVVDSGTFTTTGGNGNGSANGTAELRGTAPAISGEILQAATQAQLVYTGASGQINSGNATFTLAGKRGTETITVTANENLTDVAQRINDKSHKTGLTASVSSDTLTITSVDYGASAVIDVNISSGTFALTGGDGAGKDAGTDAVAVINGETLRGNSAAQAAVLTHAESTGLISATTTFTLTGNLGGATITLTQGDTLTQAASTINTDTANTGITATVSANNQTLILTDGTTGSSSKVEVVKVSGTFAVDGGNGDASASGSDAVTSSVVDGNRFSVNQNGLRLRIEFQPGTSGNFDPITINTGGSLAYALSTDVGIRSTLAISGTQAAQLGGISGLLDSLATGGSASGLNTNVPLATRIVDEALGELAIIEGVVDGFANAAIASSSSFTTSLQSNLQASIDSIDKVDTIEEALLQAKNQNLISNAISALAVIDQQRTSVVNLLQQIAGLPFST